MPLLHPTSAVTWLVALGIRLYCQRCAFALVPSGKVG